MSTGPTFFAGLNGFGTVYRVQEGVILPMTVADAAQLMPGVPVVQNGPYVKVTSCVPERVSNLIVRTNGGMGKRSSILTGFTSEESMAHAMSQLAFVLTTQ